MSVKYYCDICEVEITRNYVATRINGRGYQPGGNKPLLVQIIAGSESVWNVGHVCRDCLRNAVLDAIDSDVAERV